MPPEFAGVVERALSKDPADRYPSAGDLGRAALAAAGRSAAPGPERNVARGAAAPEGTPQTAATARVEACPRTRARRTSRRPPRRRRPTRRAARASAVSRRRCRALARAGVRRAAARRRARRGPARRRRRRRATAARPRRPRRRRPRSQDAEAGRVRRIATRPNGITITNGRVWVLSGTRRHDRRRSTPRTGQLAAARQDSAGRHGASPPGFGSVWALKRHGLAAALRRADDRPSHRRCGRGSASPGSRTTSRPARARSGSSSRKTGRRDGSGESLVKIDPGLRRRRRRRSPIPGGAQSVAVGEGAVWVSNAFSSSVLRVDPGNLRNTRRSASALSRTGSRSATAPSGSPPRRDKSLVTRIDARTRKRRTISLGVRPTRVAVGGGSVWVTAEEANLLIRIDPATRKVRERDRHRQRPVRARRHQRPLRLGDAARRRRRRRAARALLP